MRRLKAGLAPSTVKRDLAGLKAALNRAMKWGYTPSNPSKGVTLKADQHYRVRYLSDTERKNLLKAMKERDDKNKTVG